MPLGGVPPGHTRQVRPSSRMLLLVVTRADLLDELAVALPESTGLVKAHLADNDGLRPHLLMADLLRMAMYTHSAGDVAVTDRSLSFVDRCLREGDDYIVNVVTIAFVEHFGGYHGDYDAFFSRWPRALRQELGR